MKKAIIFFLIICMNICFSASALEEPPISQYSDVVGTEYEQAVSKLVDLEILTGYEDGKFKPLENITRAEFTAVITRVLSLDKEVAAAAGDQNFADIEAGYWAAANINVALEKNIINGYGNGRFGPEDPVTYEQAVKMIVHAFGYSKEAEQKAPYPWGGLIVAAERKIITKQTEGNVGQPISRGLIAKILYNSLDAVMADYGITLIEFLTGRTYYVSPQGSDDNVGSEKNPWKTLSKAASTVEAGSTIILEDGEYYEPSSTSFKNSGTEKAPIVVKARNKHKAKLVYPESVRAMSKISLAEGQGFYTIQDLYFTQLSIASDEDSSKTMDIFIATRAHDCKFIGNRFEGAYEEAIKLSRGADRALVEDNLIMNMNHEGIDSLNTKDVIIRNNRIIDVGRVGIMIKGGARNNFVYNNLICSKERALSTSAVTLGGETNNTSPYDIKKGTGYEAYNCIFYNNIIYSEKPGLMTTGISFISSSNCQAYNNIVVGTKNGARFVHAPGLKNGWEWDAPIVNPVLKNNIFLNCTTNTYEFKNQPENLISDYNLFYNSPSSPKEPNSIYTNPFFEEIGVDWRLKSNSPAKGAGVELPSELEGFDGSKIKLELVDFEGLLRTTPWNMGAYQGK